MSSLFKTAPKRVLKCCLELVPESRGRDVSYGDNMCAPQASLRHDVQRDSVALTRPRQKAEPLLWNLHWATRSSRGFVPVSKGL